MRFHSGQDNPQHRPGIPGETRLRGDVQRIVFSNPTTGYYVLRVQMEGHSQLQTVTGTMWGIAEGMAIEVNGTWHDHPEYGRQFSAHTVTPVLPTTPKGIQRYITNCGIPGINTKFAAAIVKKFGEETISILDNTPERLLEIPGIGKKKYQSIVNFWEEQHGDRTARIFLQGLGLTRFQCDKLIEKHTAGCAAQMVRQNPYILASEVRGVGFATADKIAMGMGIEKESPKRLVAGIVNCLRLAVQDGHTCLEEKRLIDRSQQLLEVAEALLPEALEHAINLGVVIRQTANSFGHHGRYCYLRSLYWAEDNLAARLRILLGTPLRDDERMAAKKQELLQSALPFGEAIALNPEQAQGWRGAFNSPISIITGGPGVGKTTVISTIVRTAKALKMKINLAAPTGRAARRMSEATDHDASTIHRLLRYDPVTGKFSQDHENPLQCQILVVDEVSMMDVELAQHLFDAVAPGTRVVLVGDKDQLPSVGPGSVLHDLIAVGAIPVTELVRIYRQQNGSRIITSAHQVNQGITPDLVNPPKGEMGDFYFYPQENQLQAATFVRKLVAKHIEEFFGFDAKEEIQVLTPMHRGECGTTALNIALQEELNPPSDDKPQFVLGGNPPRCFRLGDRVMQIRNNYKRGVFNGETGTIVAVDPEKRTCTVQFDICLSEYQANDCDQLVHAWAVTVHKSQGSEFPVVIMTLMPQHFMMLQRNLLYTGITRAKKLLVMVGSPKAITTAVQNNTPTRRCGLLQWRLMRLLTE